MMAASPERSRTAGDAPRRRRYERAPQPGRSLVLTPTQERLLVHLARCPILSINQLARLVNMSDKGARRQMRPIFDAGLVDLIPVGRAALAEDGVPNDARLLYGSALNIYVPTPAGRECAHRTGQIDCDGREAACGKYGPKNALFLRHELGVADVYVWLTGMADSQRAAGHHLHTWQSGAEARFDLARRDPPKAVHPDAWMVYQIGKATSGPPPVLVGLVEVDRGTERLGGRWKEKIAAYQLLFAGDRLRAVTGYGNARVLVLAPDASRRDRLAQYLGENAPAALRDRFWLAEMSVLHSLDPHLPKWKQAGSGILRPLFPPTPNVAPPLLPKGRGSP